MKNSYHFSQYPFLKKIMKRGRESEPKIQNKFIVLPITKSISIYFYIKKKNTATTVKEQKHTRTHINLCGIDVFFFFKCWGQNLYFLWIFNCFAYFLSSIIINIFFLLWLHFYKNRQIGIDRWHTSLVGGLSSELLMPPRVTYSHWHLLNL